MIFCKTKSEANELALSSCLKQDCQVLHGDIPQRQRELTLKAHTHADTLTLKAHTHTHTYMHTHTPTHLRGSGRASTRC